MAHNRRKGSDSEGWGFLSCDAGSWIPAGALAKPPTLRLIRDYLRTRSGKKSVLLIDEVCKLTPRESASQSSWSLGCWSECLALLDCAERLCAHEWSSDDIFRLQNDVLVIGAGAFMEALAEAKQHATRGNLGFGDVPESTASVRAKAIAKHLPLEILSRFHNEPIVISDPTREDFKRGILQIHAGLGITRTSPLPELVDHAMKSMGGVRWFECFTADLLMENLTTVIPMEERPKDSPEKKYDFFAADATHYTRMATDIGFELRSCLSLVLVDFAGAEKDIKEGNDREFGGHQSRRGRRCGAVPPGSGRRPRCGPGR